MASNPEFRIGPEDDPADSARSHLKADDGWGFPPLHRDPATGLEEDPEIHTVGGKRIKPKKERKGIMKVLGPIGAGILFVLSKLKTILLLAGKFKLIGTGGTMLISIGFYAWIWGWPFAVGFVLLLFCHEMGHAIELRRQGVKSSAPVFIPFLGAVIGMREMPKDAWKEALMALAGPFYGTVPAVGLWIAGHYLHSNLLIALAYTGFFLNLFNLLPMSPLDGGRVAAALHPALWFLGIAGMVALIVLWHNPLLIIILIFGLMDVHRRWRQLRHKESGDYYKLNASKRFVVALLYFGLAGFLAVAMMVTHINPHTGKRGQRSATQILTRVVEQPSGRYRIALPHRASLTQHEKLWLHAFIVVHQLNHSYRTSAQAARAAVTNLSWTPPVDLSYLAALQTGKARHA